ncbi:hypothetical protein LCM23_06460 [Cytobacillus kochii]|uniref:hypothetical protein n=1 Tax=Cytobacillus kochii TaxID=859143 RepID=UPI001CD3BBD6|nr:hypothetical protein [Cytobacillus kochii]MCA1025728.1 hypothetical protein [Cytobacillus kochii]
MSSVPRDMIEDHEILAKIIENFMWEGEPFKSKKKEHTIEKMESFLEFLRDCSWKSYYTGAKYMGWEDED